MSTQVAQSWEMQNSPDLNGQLGLTYDTDLGSYGSLVLNTAYSYRAETRMFDAVASILDQGSYSLWDAGAVWYAPGGRWSASLITNINDETYRTGGYNFPATALEDAILGFYGAPRTWTFGVSAEFQTQPLLATASLVLITASERRLLEGIKQWLSTLIFFTQAMMGSPSMPVIMAIRILHEQSFVCRALPVILPTSKSYAQS